MNAESKGDGRSGLFFKRASGQKCAFFTNEDCFLLTDTFIHDSGESIGQLGMHAVCRRSIHRGQGGEDKLRTQDWRSE